MTSEISTEISIVQAWQTAVNEQDMDRLFELSAPEIVLVGPRGRASGHQMLRAWIERAGLTLTTERIFHRGDTVVFAQHGTWLSSATEGVPSEADLATRFQVRDQQVVELERYATLAEALAAAGLSDADEVHNV